MKKTIMLMNILMSSLVHGQESPSWTEILDTKQHLFDQHPELSLLKNQMSSFAQGQAPTLAHPAIKTITIVEQGEELVDIRAMNHPRITMMPPPTKPFASDVCNSGLPNASKIRKTPYQKLEMMIHHLDELAPEFGYAPGTISIKVFEGLRDLQTQATLFQNKKTEIMTSNPAMTDEQADTETSKWVSPVKNYVPLHSTGAAIDMRLWNETTKNFLDLGKIGVIWGENPTAPTFSEALTTEQKYNRLYLVLAASKAGLINYVYEWWHFSYADRYAAYWQENDAAKRISLYNAVN